MRLTRQCPRFLQWSIYTIEFTVSFQQPHMQGLPLGHQPRAILTKPFVLGFGVTADGAFGWITRTCDRREGRSLPHKKLTLLLHGRFPHLRDAPHPLWGETRPEGIER